MEKGSRKPQKNMITRYGDGYMYSLRKGKEYFTKKGKKVDIGQCFICGYTATEKHHCMGGRDRAKCDELQLIVPLCDHCHWLAHNKPKESGIYYMLKKVAQKVFEKYIGSREKWMETFHKNYL